MKHSEKKFKTLNIKGKEYVEVNQRIKYLAFEFDGEYSIDTDYTYFPERKMWVVKARLTLHQADIRQVYTGLAQEVESDNWKDVNHTSALENCETSAVGRACAMAGIGIENSIASADEVKKAIKRQERTQPPKNEPAPEKEVRVMATVKQKTELLLLVNSNLITNEEKNKMIEGINKLTTERATEAIAKLKKTIEERGSVATTDLKMKLEEVKQEAIKNNFSDIVDAIDNRIEKGNGTEEEITELIKTAQREIKIRREKYDHANH